MSAADICQLTPEPVQLPDVNTLPEAWFQCRECRGERVWGNCEPADKFYRPLLRCGTCRKPTRHGLWSINPRPVLPWLNISRWLGWGLGVVLMLIHWANDHFSFTYGIAAIAFSAGLSIPQSWVKRRFAPDLLEPSGEWWPSKSE